MIFSNKAFDILKWVALVALPALAIFVSRLFPIWNLPLGEEIAATIGAVDFLLGALLGVSTVQYNMKKKQDAEDCYVQMALDNNEFREEMYPAEEMHPAEEMEEN